MAWEGLEVEARALKNGGDIDDTLERAIAFGMTQGIIASGLVKLTREQGLPEEVAAEGYQVPNVRNHLETFDTHPPSYRWSECGCGGSSPLHARGCPHEPIEAE